MKKLYIVYATATLVRSEELYILAEDEKEAQQIAEDKAYFDFDFAEECDKDFEPSQIFDIPKGEEDIIPLGQDGEAKTCKEILEELSLKKEKSKVDKSQLELKLGN